MPLDSAGAVLLLEVRPGARARKAPASVLERAMAEATVLLEAPTPGTSWSRASDRGIAGTMRFEDAAQAFAVLHRLRTELRSEPSRPPIELVAGLGRGDTMEASRLAAQAFRSLGRRGRALTCARTEDADANAVLGALCGTLDSLLRGWTDAQWQAIHRRDRGRTLQQIGEELGIAYQNVSKRLIAARYSLYREVLDAAALVFSRATLPA